MAMGRIHSWESMGLVDGPGIRTVIFLQGCRLRYVFRRGAAVTEGISDRGPCPV